MLLSFRSRTRRRAPEGVPSVRPRALRAPGISLFALAVAVASGPFAPAGDAFADATATRVRRVPLDVDAPFRRLLWVSRWDFASASDIDRIFENAAAARYTDVLFQVRGEGTVFFRSPYEPWAGELTAGAVKGVGRDPGWDPLAAAIRAARRNGVRIHAWANTMPGWNQREAPPADSNQLYARRRSWFMTDEQGRAMKPNGFYACLEPGLPEVQDHLAMLFGRLAADYEIDGVHLDYVRYPTADDAGKEYWYHPRVVEAFRKETGKAPAEDPAAYSAFRRRQVSMVVAHIRQALMKARPGLELSAAVLADMDKATEKAAQEPLEWLRLNLVDAVAPMAYVRGDNAKFEEYCSHYFGDPGLRARVWPGIWPRKENPDYLDQVDYACDFAPGGVAMFCYADIFSGHRSTARATEITRRFLAKRSVPRAGPSMVAGSRPAPFVGPGPRPGVGVGDASGSREARTLGSDAFDRASASRVPMASARPGVARADKLAVPGTKVRAR